MKDEYKKVELEVQSTKDAINEQMASLGKVLTELEQGISTATISRDTKRDELQNLRNNSQKLEAELAELKQQHLQLTQDVNTLAESKQTTEEKISTLTSDKNSLETEISSKESKLSELEGSIASLTQNLAEVKDKLVNVEKVYEEKVASIEKEIDHLKDQSKIRLNQYKILQHLLDDSYVPDSEYNVIKVLKQPGVSSFNQVVLSSGVAQNTVKEVLTDLSSRGYLDFDQGSGEFTILKELSI